MTDNELELDLDTQETTEDIISRKDKRLKSLNDSVREQKELLAKESEEKSKLLAEKEALEKEAKFYKDFNQVSSKYQGAGEYQDKIREKAALGLDVEEATMLVLTKEGKYQPPVPKVERESAAGGSAYTNVKGNDSKTPEEMSQAERRAALEEAFSKGDFRI